MFRLAPEGDRAIEGQKSQPMGAKASEGKPEGKPAIGPKRGSAVSILSHCSSGAVLTPACCASPQRMKMQISDLNMELWRL